MLPSRIWSELTTADLAGVDMAAQIAILPVAATEQHGPHLPLGTDTFIMDGYLARVLDSLPPEIPALVLPTQNIGCSVEHGDFAGTVSLAAQTGLAAWGGVIDAVRRCGCRKLVVISSHGGNSAVVDILAHEARARHAMLVVRAAWQRFGTPAGLFTPAEQAHGVHGGQIETSLMLAFRPDLVRMDQARDFVPTTVALEGTAAQLRAGGRPTGFGWMAGDLHPAGVAGNAAGASAAIGEALAAHGAAAFIALLRDVCAFDVATLAQGKA